MQATEFETTLRQLVRSRPFRPFAFIMKGGEKIVADIPNAVAFSGGAASCETEEMQTHLIDCENVDEIRLLAQEVPS